MTAAAAAAAAAALKAIQYGTTASLSLSAYLFPLPHSSGVRHWLQCAQGSVKAAAF